MTLRIPRVHKLAQPGVLAKNVRALRLWVRERYFLLRQPALPDPIFVLGCCRSGTTIVYQTIARSLEVRALGYATQELWDGIYGPHHNGWHSEAADASAARPEHRARALAHFVARLGPARFLDKTCIHAIRVPYLQQLFPGARFVFVYRDGRDNVSSLMDGWRKGGPFRLAFLGACPEPVAIENGMFRDWRFFLPPGWRAYNRAPLAEVCAFQWVTANEMALDAAARVPVPNWVPLRYEDLLSHPVEAFTLAFERLELRFTPDVRDFCATLRERPTSIISGAPAYAKWRTRNPEAIARVWETIRPTMERLGYDKELGDP